MHLFSSITALINWDLEAINYIPSHHLTRKARQV